MAYYAFRKHLLRCPNTESINLRLLQPFSASRRGVDNDFLKRRPEKPEYPHHLEPEQ
jgi:hypothetical protein